VSAVGDALDGDSSESDEDVTGSVTVVGGTRRPRLINLLGGGDSDDVSSESDDEATGTVSVIPGSVTVIGGERKPGLFTNLISAVGEAIDSDSDDERDGGIFGGIVNTIGGGLTTIIDGVRGGAEGTFDFARQVAQDPLRTASGAITLGSRLVSNADRLRFIRLGWFWLNGQLYNRDGFRIDFDGKIVGPQIQLNGAIEGGISGAVNLAGAIGGDALRLATGAITLKNGQVITNEMRLRFLRLGWFIIDGVLYNAQGLRVGLDGSLIGGAFDLAGDLGGRILTTGAGALDVVSDVVGTGINFLGGVLGGGDRDGTVQVQTTGGRQGLRRPGLFGGLVSAVGEVLDGDSDDEATGSVTVIGGT